MGIFLIIVYLAFSISIFYTLRIVRSFLEERITNLEMSCYALIALLWPLELTFIFVVLMLIGPLVYIFRFLRRSS